jgi:hypothetical protein
MVRKDAGVTAVAVVRVVVGRFPGEKLGLVIRWKPYEIATIAPSSARMIAATTTVVRTTRIEVPR